MAAYLYANVDVSDPVGFATYGRDLPALVATFGGRYLVRGGAVTVLEGQGVPHRQVIVEFPDMARLKAFYASPEYERLIPIRQGASTGTLFAIEGV